MIDEWEPREDGNGQDDEHTAAAAYRDENSALAAQMYDDRIGAEIEDGERDAEGNSLMG